MMMQTNKGCLRCCEAASKVIRWVTWCWRAMLAPPVVRDNHQCAGHLCFKMTWEEWSHFCNEECRIHAECDLFYSKIIGYLHPNKLNPDLWEWFWIYFVSRSIHWYLFLSLFLGSRVAILAHTLTWWKPTSGLLWQPAQENTVLSPKTDPLWSLSNNKVSSCR
jgi:hypothetical protein